MGIKDTQRREMRGKRGRPAWQGMARRTPGCQFAGTCALGPYNGGKPPAGDRKPPYRAPSVGDSVGEIAGAF
jgi:hypothetical protein